jgi:glycerol-3-phosphate O-acyltransferase
MPVIDPDRDAAYTQELGTVLAERYQRDTVLMSTQVVAHVLFRHLVQATPGMDLFSRLRLRNEISIDRSVVHKDLAEARDRLLALEAKDEVRISDVVREDSPDDLLEGGLQFWSGYHSSTAANLEGDRVLLCDPSLLLYYQNRLVPFAERIADSEQMPAACEIEALGVHR